MKFSIWPLISREWSEIAEITTWADEVGWHGMWFADHYMTNADDGSVNNDPAHECWATLAAVAAITRRLRIGPLVSPTTVHHPALLAHRAATIDHISSGRFVLGIGAGWQVNEHRAYGIDLLDAGPRVTRFAEAIEIVHRLLREERVTFSGEHFQFTDAPCEPKPFQRPLPIAVGTGGPRMMGHAVRWAQEWNTWGDVAEIARRTESFVEACGRAGRDPESFHRSAQAMVFITDDQAATDKVKGFAPADRSIVGTPAQLTDEIGQMGELGVDEFIVLDATLGNTAPARRAGYERFWTEVASQFA